MALNPAALAALDRKPYISLVTFRRSGDAVQTPVWFAAYDGKLYVFSEADAWKVKRLRNDQRVRVAACSVRGRVSGEWFEGKGSRIEDPATEQRAYAALRAKYGWKMRLTDFVSKLAGRIDGRAVLELEI
ncbi:MAG: PPOX class F420-dependent oxidoreductase [Myxococcota bacterium]